jgi:site-specific recombinase XerD
VIQHYLGHAKIETTEFYTQVAMGHLRRATDKLLENMSTNNTE